MIKSPVENLDYDGEYRGLGQPILPERAGQRIDAYLAHYYPFLSRAAWQRRLKIGDVRVDGLMVDSSFKLRTRQQLALYHPPSVEPEVDRGIYPLWRVGSVMAVFKPAPLPMHENGPYRKNTFAEILKTEVGPEWAAVHRLDRETSGIVLCGGTYETRKSLAASLASRTLQKEYLAIGHGRCRELNWTEHGPIGDLSNSEIRIKKWVVPGGQSAETRFQVLEQKDEHVLLKVYPKTGRTNQIRIHAAFAGHHLVGDRLFHPDEKVFLEWFLRGVTEQVIQQTGFKRCLLHAHALTFVHPEDKKVHEVRCPLPEDMQSFWDSI